MKNQIMTLDEIAIHNRGYKINPPKKVGVYLQKMQSLYGSRRFLLRTEPIYDNVIRITLLEKIEGDVLKKVASRTAIHGEEETIRTAIKSLQRKAGCCLYYVLLISTDGEYL